MKSKRKYAFTAEIAKRITSGVGVRLKVGDKCWDPLPPRPFPSLPSLPLPSLPLPSHIHPLPLEVGPSRKRFWYILALKSDMW